MPWLLKTTMWNIICFLIALFLVPPLVLAEKPDNYRFLKKLTGLNSSQIRRIARRIPDTPKIIKVDISTINKSLPNIDEKQLSPDVLKLAAIGGQIAKSGNFANRFMNYAPNPSQILLQYLKYGKFYLKTAQAFSNTVITHARDLSESSAKQLKNFGSLSKETIIRFKKEDYVNAAFVSVLRRTGKKGYETVKTITEWSSKNPTKTAVAALLIWYTTDPEGCTDSIKNFADFLAKGGTDIVFKSSGGPGTSFLTSLVMMWDKTIIQYCIIGALLSLSLIILCSRTIRTLILFPFKTIRARLIKNMDNKKANIIERKRRSNKGIEREQNQIIKRPSKSSHTKTNAKEAKGLF